jgi:hypothetical protein
MKCFLLLISSVLLLAGCAHKVTIPLMPKDQSHSYEFGHLVDIFVNPSRWEIMEYGISKGKPHRRVFHGMRLVYNRPNNELLIERYERGQILESELTRPNTPDSCYTVAENVEGSYLHVALDKWFMGPLGREGKYGISITFEAEVVEEGSEMQSSLPQSFYTWGYFAKGIPYAYPYRSGYTNAIGRNPDQWQYSDEDPDFIELD